MPVPQAVNDESDFRNGWHGVAEPIYDYLETLPRGVLGFDGATVSWPESATARFSCVADDGWHQREVSITARRLCEEAWTLTHREEQVVRRPPPPKGTRYFLE